jgi:tRNA pseudouridine13 synthase
MPFLTEALPGTGGLLKSVPEDFVVEELPAYPASGEGTHTFVFLEKRALTTEEALTRLCGALGVKRDDAGAAGSKDRQAVTRQWVSLPSVEPDKVKALTLEGIRILEAQRHGHKLRTGHLRGNRFTITVRGTTDGVARARAILEALAARGCANLFGAQRFGARGDNAPAGRRLLDGQGDRRLSRGQRRLMVSAYQASLFNRYLERRMADGLLHTALDGDVLKKTDSGGLFIVDDVAEAQTRLDAGALVVTGPMYGHKMLQPKEGSPSRAREDAILVEENLTEAAFGSLGKLAEGTRRPLLCPLADVEVNDAGEPGAIAVSFVLPPGAYATVVLAEVMKNC